MSKVTSTAESRASTSVTAKLGGSGWGLSASVSASYKSQNGASSTSMSFYSSQYVDTVTLGYENVGYLALTEGAKNILHGDNPLDFLDFFGSGFVYQISYSGYFLGCAHVYSTTSSSSEDLSVVASFDYKGGVFSATGSASFSNNMANSKSSLQEIVSYTFSGGDSVPQMVSSPQEVANNSDN